MARTLIDGKDNIKDRSIRREDVDITTPGHSLITKIIPGNNITISSTGADEGTGDVIINAEIAEINLKIPFVYVTLKNNTRYLPRYSYYTVPFNKIVINQNLNFNINNSKFEVPENGIYELYARFNFSSYARNTYIGYKLNSSNKNRGKIKGYESITTFREIVELTKGQTISFIIYTTYYIKLLGTFTTAIIKRIG